MLGDGHVNSAIKLKGNPRKMDNFHFVDIKPTIDRKETASIKDAIFRRAREKARELTEEKAENYTAEVQNDVMDIARETLQPSPMNPFNQFMENLGIQNAQREISKSIEEIEKPKVENENPKLEEIYTKEIKHNIESISDKAFANAVQTETMEEARRQFRTNLNETLSFLNAQAAIRAAEYAHSKINFSV